MPPLFRLLTRLSLYGDLPTRFLTWLVRYVPSFLEPIAILTHAFVIFLLAGGMRRAIMRNLQVILPGTSRWGNFFRAYRVFWNYAWTLVEAAHCRNEKNALDWEIPCKERLDRLVESESGVLILTAHMGTYDVAASVFSEKFRNRLLTVRIPEREPELQELMEKTRRNDQNGKHRIVYNRSDDKMLGLELACALARGDIVAIQGDRTLPGIAEAPARLFGREARVPKGPFVLASTTGVDVYPVFVIRKGRLRYEIRVDEPFRCGRQEGGREDALRACVDKWCAILENVAGEHWHQWYVLEPLFGKDAA